MIQQERIELYYKAIGKFGEDAQKMMLIEECGELLNALAKRVRGRASDDDVITELADVAIMVEQMAVLFGYSKFESEKERKLERLKERLKKYEQNEQNPRI